MRKFINFNLRDKIKGNKKKLSFLFIFGYTSIIVFTTTLTVKNGYVGNIFIPMAKTNILMLKNYLNGVFSDVDNYTNYR